jgi:hypothetical protein
MAGFETLSDQAIKNGECTDICFVRTEETLRLAKINPVVSMEVTASALPELPEPVFEGKFIFPK